MKRLSRPIILILSTILIVFWQLNLSSKTYIQTYSRGGTGIELSAAARFTYFYYYLNLFPLATDHRIETYSKEAAYNTLINYPKDLRMETGSHIAWGSYLNNYLLRLSAMLKHTSNEAWLIPINGILFISSLVLLFWVTYLSGKGILGAVLVLLMGSNQHQLYETYSRSNIFSFNISLLLICIALSIPLIFDVKRVGKIYSIFITPALGILFGTFMFSRFEVLTGLLPIGIALLFTKRLNLKYKVLSLTFLAIFLTITNIYWKNYFNCKFRETYNLLTEFDVDKERLVEKPSYYHVFWHAMSVGLADVQNKYGYGDLNDQGPPEYARPELLTQDFEKFSQLPMNSWMVTPEYSQIIKERVLGDVRNHPLWYFSILGNRIRTMFENVIPVSIIMGEHKLEMFITGYIFFFTLATLLALKDAPRLLLLISSLANSVTIILVTSAFNTPYMSIFHMFSIALLVDLVLSIKHS